jgi:hypothetical protein
VGRTCLTIQADIPALLPADPFRGIDAYRFSDQQIFFAREQEIEDARRQVIVYRGVFVYGESGVGKSSLVNAGLLPEVIKHGFVPERIRVQPRAGAEFVVERISVAEGGTELLHSGLAPEGDTAMRVVLSAQVFRDRVLASAETSSPLLVFDQFEEIVTLFEEARAGEKLREGRELQAAVVGILVELLGLEEVPVKILFSFREDYLAKVRRLLRKRPELVDQVVHLTPPETDALFDIIRGPFERFPGRFERELTPQFAQRLVDAFASRTGVGPVNLSELQIVCDRLQAVDEPEQLFEERGLVGIVEDSVFEVIGRFPEELQYPALAVLAQMVTGSGVRTVISADDLVERVRQDEPIAEEEIREALGRLEQETRLVRRERRRDIDVYEITSEFLVPWISYVRERRLGNLRESETAQRRRWHDDLQRAIALEDAGRQEDLDEAVRIATSLIIQSRYADFEVYHGATALLYRLADTHQPTAVRKAAGRGINAASSMEEELETYTGPAAAHVPGVDDAGLVPVPRLGPRRMLAVLVALTALAAVTLFATDVSTIALLDLVGWHVDTPHLLFPGIILAVIWGGVYTLEAIAYGNERLNPLAAPFRPYSEGFDLIEQWSGWPFNLVLPWVLAYAGAAVAGSAGVDPDITFYLVLGAASFAALWSYNEAVILL